MSGMRGVAELLRRYVAAIREAWRARDQMASPVRSAEEAEFLPAALALQETPVSPAPRIAMGLILVFAAIAVLWACFGRVDVVATAPGRIIPDGHSKLIQPMEMAKVAAIHVREGQSVAAGQLLVELDATVTEADLRRLQNELIAARLEEARARAFLAALDGSDARLAEFEGVARSRLQDEQRLLEGQLAEYHARLRRLSAEIHRRQTEARTMTEAVRKLEQTAPLVRQRAEDYKGLVAQNFISKHGYQERELEAIEQEQDLAASRSKLAEIAAGRIEAERQRDALIAETRRIQLDQQREAAQRVLALQQELAKADQRGRAMRMTAPVAGTVQQLAVHTIGGVVSPGQTLMQIVPRDNELEVEAHLDNRDVGFVHPGQRAAVKVETFPFTRYGTLTGEIVQVSSDAIQDEKRGLVFAARVRLGQRQMQVEARAVNLSPGMAVVVEIKTGTRRVIEYFLSPLLQYGSESLRER
jgi:hemolysin D